METPYDYAHFRLWIEVGAFCARTNAWDLTLRDVEVHIEDGPR